MKVLAIEKDIDGIVWTDADNILKHEALHVFQLYLSDVLREIYFTGNKNAVLILETTDKNAAEQLLSALPLVKAGMIRFEIMELKPYSGYERLFNPFVETKDKAE